MCALKTQKSDLCWSVKKEFPYKRESKESWSVGHEIFTCFLNTQHISSTQSCIQCSVAMSTYYTVSDSGLVVVVFFQEVMNCSFFELISIIQSRNLACQCFSTIKYDRLLTVVKYARLFKPTLQTNRFKFIKLYKFILT